MQVLKFGGSSVANAQNMAKVIDIVTKAVDRDRTILVSSAISGCTDTLIKIGTLASERDEIGYNAEGYTPEDYIEFGERAQQIVDKAVDETLVFYEKVSSYVE